MAGHSRSKNGVASLTCDPVIHVFGAGSQDVDARDIGEGSDAVLQTAMRGHDETLGMNKLRYATRAERTLAFSSASASLSQTTRLRPPRLAA